MVEGLDKFRSFFSDYPDSYILIGGAACDVLLEEAGFTARATKDLDIILVVEALNEDFVRHFWEFIHKGGYQIREKSIEKKNYYRFLDPTEPGFPKQLELFARKPEVIDYEGDGHLTPIPVDAELSSLSAILMEDGYYEFTLQQSMSINDLHLANDRALIILKAKAYLDMQQRKEAGEAIDRRNIKKHKNDIFRLGSLLTPEGLEDLPEKIKGDMRQFTEVVKDDLPERDFFKKSMGMPGVNPKDVLDLLKSNFGLS